MANYTYEYIPYYRCFIAAAVMGQVVDGKYRLNTKKTLSSSSPVL